MNKVVERYDIFIICGRRGREDQEEAFRTGKSKARFGQSKHNWLPSPAVDVVPWPFNQGDWNQNRRTSDI